MNQNARHHISKRKAWQPWVGGFLLGASTTLSATESPSPTAGSPAVQPATAQIATTGMQLVGETRLRVWGFEVYTARLLAPAGFDPAQYAQQPFGLELNYLRAFDGADIARRSIDEMQGQQAIADEQAARWLKQLEALFPNVKKGDRILGLHRPGKGAEFFFNDARLGAIDDPELARRFFGIWMSPATSQPAMRQALISGGRLPR